MTSKTEEEKTEEQKRALKLPTMLLNGKSHI